MGMHTHGDGSDTTAAGGGDPTARLAIARLLEAFNASTADEAGERGDGWDVTVGYLALPNWLAEHADRWPSPEALLADAALPAPEPLVSMGTQLAYTASTRWHLVGVRAQQFGLILHLPDTATDTPPALLASWHPWHSDAALAAALRCAWQAHIDDLFVGQTTTPHGRVSPSMLSSALFHALETHPEYWAVARDYAFPLDTSNQRCEILYRLLQNAV